MSDTHNQGQGYGRIDRNEGGARRGGAAASSSPGAAGGGGRDAGGGPRGFPSLARSAGHPAAPKILAGGSHPTHPPSTTPTSPTDGPRIPTDEAALVGYARVSTGGQDLALQRDALMAAGVVGIYEDTASGALTSRPRLDACLAELQPGDTLVVYKLDRLGRSLAHLIEVIDDLGRRGVGFRSLTEGFDTTCASGKLLMHIIAAMAEFERSLIRERTTAGVAAAQRRGKHCGRPFSLTDDHLALARRLLKEGQSQRAVAELLKVSPVTIRRAFRTK